MKKVIRNLFLLLILAGICWLAVGTVQNHAAMVAAEEYQSAYYATAWSLLPPAIAILLALITKEVYSSLFIGILTGGLLYANFNLEKMINTIFFQEDGGMISKL